MLVQTMLALAVLTVAQDSGRGGASGAGRPLAARGDGAAAVRISVAKAAEAATGAAAVHDSLAEAAERAPAAGILSRSASSSSVAAARAGAPFAGAASPRFADPAFQSGAWSPAWAMGWGAGSHGPGCAECMAAPAEPADGRFGGARERGETLPVGPEIHPDGQGERRLVGAVSSPDSGGVLTNPSSPAALPWAAPRPAAADTPVKRERAVEYSDWYARRLMVHRIASYTILPLFALQYYTGTQLMAKGASAPRWVIKTHGPLATTMLVVFSVNTVTGGWNLWEARKDPNGRTARTLHGLLMLAADAGFVTAGYLSKPAENSASTRSLHRTVALSSIGAALVSYAIMLPPFRR